MHPIHAPAAAVLRTPVLLRRRPVALGLSVAILLASSSCGGSDSTGPGGGGAPSAPVLAAASGDDQAAPPSASLPIAPQVRLTSAGRPVAGAIIRFQVTSGGGAIARVADTTDAQGLAEAGTWTIGASVGINALEARVEGTNTTMMFSARGAAQVATAAEVSVGTSGGVVHPVLTGSGIDTLTISVPAGAFATTTTFRVSSLPVPPSGAVQGAGIVARLHIDAGGATTDSIVRVHVPLRTRTGQVVAAYWYDSTTQRLDPIQVIAADTAGITIGTGTFSWGTSDGITPSLRRNLTAAGDAPMLSILGRFRELVLTVVEQATLLEKNATTTFKPGRDDWDFVNLGSYITPNGNCHGQTLSALWYHDVHGSVGGQPLSRYHTLAPKIAALFGHDNREAYLHATMVQRDADRSLKTQLLLYTVLVTESDRLNFLMLVDAMRRTNKPQLIGVAQSASVRFGVTGGHALIAYGVEIDGIQGRILIADPNRPGSTAPSIVFDRLSGRYEPYSGATRGEEATASFPVVRFIPRVLVPTWSEVGTRWNEFLASPRTVASGQFPEYALYGETTDWLEAVVPADTLPTTWEDSVLLSAEAAYGEHPFKVTGFHRDSTVAGGWVQGARVGPESKVKLDTGVNRMTVYMTSTKLANETAAERFMDVRRITIARRPLALASAAGALLPPADTVKFDAGMKRRFALRFNTGAKPLVLDHRELTVANITGATGVTGVAEAFVNAEGQAPDSVGITFSTADTNVKRIRFDLRYRGKLVQNVIAQVVKPQVILSVNPAVVTGTRTSSVVGDTRSNLLVCAMSYAVEVRGTGGRTVIGEEYRITTDSGRVLEERVDYPVSQQSTVGPGRYTGTGRWDWRVDQHVDLAPWWMPFRVEWRVLYRNEGETEVRQTNDVSFRCQ